MHAKNISTAGKKISEAKKVLVMIHGRGAFAEDMLSLAGHFNIEDYALIAPRATNNTWYPYSFLAPPLDLFFNKYLYSYYYYYPFLFCFFFLLLTTPGCA